MVKIGEVPEKVGRMRNVEPLDPPLSGPMGSGTPRKSRTWPSATKSTSLDTRENRLIWVCSLLVNGGLSWRALPQLGRSYLIIWFDRGYGTRGPRGRISCSSDKIYFLVLAMLGMCFFHSLSVRLRVWTIHSGKFFFLILRQYQRKHRHSDALASPPLLKLDAFWIQWASVTVKIRCIQECTYEYGPILSKFIVLKATFAFCIISWIMSSQTYHFAMSKQREVDIAPVGNEPSDAQNDHVFASDLEKKLQHPSNMQAGVQKADLLREAWTKQGLIMVFSGWEQRHLILMWAWADNFSLLLCTFAINFADYSTQVYTPYTTSSFKQHSAMSAAKVVMNIARISAYPIIAKLGDVSMRIKNEVISALILF